MPLFYTQSVLNLSTNGQPESPNCICSLSEQIYILKEKSRNMKFFSESLEDSQKFNNSQFKTICDWLRNIDNNVRQINYQYKTLHKFLTEESPEMDQEVNPLDDK